jgi:carboxyl-terminal processing protease
MTAAPPPPADPATRSRRPRPTWGAVLALAIVAFLGGALVDRSLPGLTSLVPPAPAAASAGAPSPTAVTGEGAFALIRQAWDLLHQQYVGRSDLDDQKLAHEAIDAMTTAVGDTEHTVFLTPEQVKEADSSLSGEYVGIGAIVDETDDGLRIEGVFPDTPADEAGLGVGDLVLSVDGTSTVGADAGTVTDLIRGPKGSMVELRVDPAGPAGPRTVTLTRRSVTIPVVDWAMVPGTTIADIRLYQFSNGAIEKVADAITKAKAAGATAILLDLRGNPGGFVDQAVGIASQFLDSGAVFQTEDASGKREVSSVRPGGVGTDIPSAVLVDRSTASAAEILASALQEGRHAPIVGEKTFGTGTVLSRFPLADGSALEIGVERWLTRDGRALWHEGLTPDHVVALPEGVDPVSPPDLRKLDAAGVRDLKDVQLLAGLKQLGWQ